MNEATQIVIEETDTPSVISAIYDHCVAVYKAMLEEAEMEELDGLVYEGHLTRLIIQDLGLSTPYYTQVKRRLVAMGCIEQLRRGGGHAMSRWKLLTEPTEESFNSIASQKHAPKGKYAVLAQQLRDLNRRVTQLEMAFRGEAQ